MAALTLPSEPKALVEAIDSIVDAAVLARAPYEVIWKFNNKYLQGARNLRVQSWKTAQISGGWGEVGDKGVMKMRLDIAAVKMQRELGRLLRMNTLPLVRAKSLGLDSQRRRAVGQVTLDSLVTGGDPDQTKLEAFSVVLRYGTVGLQASEDTTDGVSRPSLEVVTPMELFPVPGRIQELGQMVGIGRRRKVPLPWLKSQVSKRQSSRKLSRKDSDLHIENISYGEATEVSGYDYPAIDITGWSSESSQGDPQDPNKEWVTLTEIWMYGTDKQRVGRYVAKVGCKILTDIEYEAEEQPPCPLGHARYINTGSFYGVSYLQLCVPLAREAEEMLANAFRNVKEFDLFGTTLIPREWGVQIDTLTARGKPKYAHYDPDTMSAKPGGMERITPTNSGNMPANILNLCLGVIDQVTGDSEIFAGKSSGRQESGVGIGMLFETGSVHQIPVGVEFETMYATVYRSILANAKKFVGESAVEIAIIDDMVAGIVLDSQGRMALDDTNQVPGPFDVIVGIRERQPHLVEQRAQELIQMHQLGILDPDDMVWINYSEDLGLPLGRQEVVEEYRKAMLRNIVQFNDGKTPSPVIVSSLDDHKIQLKRLKVFMARPEVSLASVEVRQAIENRYNQHMVALGGYPEQMPFPEEMGMSQEQTPGAQQGPGMSALQWGQSGSIENAPPQLQEALAAVANQQQAPSMEF